MNCGGNLWDDIVGGIRKGVQIVTAPLNMIAKIPGINAVAGPISQGVGIVGNLVGAGFEGGYGTPAGAAKSRTKPSKTHKREANITEAIHLPFNRKSLAVFGAMARLGKP